MPTLYIIRGLPGSGKSTLAKIIAKGSGAYHVETDMFFERDGVYQFDGSLLPEYHKRCQYATLTHLSQGDNVVVSNTFSRIWEMQPYLDMGYPTVVIECQTQFQNIHSVPDSSIKRMKARWEKYNG